MYQRSKMFIFLAILLFSCSLSSQASAKKPAGFRFPPIEVPYFQYKAGQAYKKNVLKFSDLVGKQAFVLFYFLPQHHHSITELKAFAMAAQLFKGKLKFLAVTKAQSPAESKKAYAKMKELNISLPVILDKKGLMAYVMLTRRVPSYSIVTKSGFLRLARAGQLSEQVTAKESLLGIMMRLAQGKDIPFIRAPGYSPNPYNLIRKRAPLFHLNHALTKKPFDLGKTLKKGKPVLLVFWSITCPHCQKTLPPLERYVEKKRNEFQTISLVIAPNKKLLEQLKTFSNKHNLKSPVLNDIKGKAFSAYKIMTVPTLYLLGPKGIVHAVRLGGGKNIGKAIEGMMAAYRKQRSATKKKQAVGPKALPAKKPVKAAKKPVKAAKKPVKAVKKPVKAVKKPVKAVKKPVKAAKKPVKTKTTTTKAAKKPTSQPTKRTTPKKTK